jgi:zinc transport system ATP-binding protein
MIGFSHRGCHGKPCCLRVQNLSVNISNDNILQNISFRLHCGQMTALIGPNGAGKSTLLKAILGQQEYDGVIAFSIPGHRHAKAKIGYVPQTPAVDPGDPMTVADLFTCVLWNKPAFLKLNHSKRELILNCLDRVDGKELIDKRLGTLSGGEMQRVLLSLALEPVPNILILDEPLSGVDAEGIETLMELVDSIRHTYDLSVLMTTHDFSVLRKYADTVILLDKSILLQGEAEDVLSSDEFLSIFHIKGGESK